LKTEERVIRTCGWDASKYVGECYYKAGYGGRQDVCTCNTDNCNASTSLGVTLSLLVGMALSALVLVFRKPL